MRTPSRLDHAGLDPHALQGSPRTSVVRDAMITDPKTLPAHASIADAGVVLVDDHVHMMLLTHDNTLRGTLTRADLAGVPGHEPALAWAVLAGRTVTPETPAAHARALMVQTGLRRLAVIDTDHTLLGLLCLKRSGSGFCSDADVASRAVDTPTMSERRTLA